MRESSQSGAVAPFEGLQLPYLDGLRGLCALYVVLNHTTLTYLGDGTEILEAHRALLRWLQHGHYAVAIFIVLSGFCLMLPIVNAPGMTIRGGAAGFFRRRMWRILPAYYAAVAMSLGMIWVFPPLRETSGTFWSMSLPAFAVDVVSSHLLLVHNVSTAWVYKINSPMWSVATEWQIYLLFPTVLLPLCRRFGIFMVVASASIVSLGPHLLLRKSGFTFDWACPWYLGLFTMGMAGAVIAVNPGKCGICRFIGNHLNAITTGLVGLCVGVFTITRWPQHYLMPTDFLIGAIATCAIVSCADRSPLRRGRMSSILHGIVRCLEMRSVLALGAFSYSLYLIHTPYLVSYHKALATWGLPHSVSLLTMFGIGVPAAILFAYLFHLLFERPFLKTRFPANRAGMPSSLLCFSTPKGERITGV